MKKNERPKPLTGNQSDIEVLAPNEADRLRESKGMKLLDQVVQQSLAEALAGRDQFVLEPFFRSRRKPTKSVDSKRFRSASPGRVFMRSTAVFFATSRNYPTPRAECVRSAIPWFYSGSGHTPRDACARSRADETNLAPRGPPGNACRRCPSLPVGIDLKPGPLLVSSAAQSAPKTLPHAAAPVARHIIPGVDDLRTPQFGRPGISPAQSCTGFLVRNCSEPPVA